MDSRKNVGAKNGEPKVEQAEAANNAVLNSGLVKEFSWLQIARAEMGVQEVPGSGNNPRVIQYHATTTLRANEDAVPWCSSFVNWCIEKAGYKGTRSAAARSWLSWGTAAQSFIPIGSVVVMKRRGGGHVGFKVAEDPFYVYVLGGNQSDAVNIRAFAHTQVVAYRLPEMLNDDDDLVYEYLISHQV